MRIAILGAGGLGKAAAQIVECYAEMQLVAVADAGGCIHRPAGIAAADILRTKAGGSVAEISGGTSCDDAIGEVIELSAQIDGVFLALPNLPNSFIPGVVQRFLKGGYRGCFVDALKRTAAMEMVFEMDTAVREAGCVYLTGCGATPGLLTAAAALAAQSFVKVENVDIHWGVGIERWDDYKATIREDIAHMPGFNLESAQAMTDSEVEQLLDQTDGKLRLSDMEHADDVMLERAGVVSPDNVHVGGVMDTRSATKPVSTTMTLTGITFEGKRSQHRFILGDETSMAANVCGPALGYLKRAQWLRERGVCGVFGSAEMMPMVVH